MSRAPEQLAPSWLPRQQRRRIDRALRALLLPGTCSICGGALRHNSRTVGGLDAQGNVVLAGGCCADQVTSTFVLGLYSDRRYDFLQAWGDGEPSTMTSPTNEQIADAIAAYQKVIADTDKRLDGIERRGGVARALKIGVLDTPWKDDDRSWFEQNRHRSHRMRAPFPGELDGVQAPAGRNVIVLVRQVEPGRRLRAAFDPDVIPLPGSPDDEACAHALFEAAMGREPRPPDAATLDTLIKKYTVSRSAS